MSSGNEGPDQIKPATSDRTINPEECVRLRIPQSGTAMETTPPVSIPSALMRMASTYPNAVALSYKSDGIWRDITYKEYENLVRTVAKAFIHLGLERFHSVCILGFNSPEWFISNLAGIYAGGCAAGIYTTNSEEACLHCALESRANIIVVEDEKQLKKIQAIRSQLPHLKAVIQYDGEPKDSSAICWAKLLEIGRNQTDDLLEARLKSIAVNECCTFVFTSGTIGKPKAVMLQHDNLTWDALAITERVQAEMGAEIFVSYLPLSHVAAQIVDIYIPLIVAGKTCFADKNALKGSLVNTLQEVQPTRFLGVPRVWEKIYEKMMQVAAQNSGLKKTISTWAKAQATQHHMDEMSGIESNTWGYILAKSLIFKRVKQALGLGQCKLCVNAAAPLSPHIKKYFTSLDIPILDAFGMSETSGAHTLCSPAFFDFETIGACLPGAKAKILKPNEEGHGEISITGRNIFMGYVGEPVKTDEMFDENGWINSGDVGYIDKRGKIYITGRSKELLITAGGENVAPVPIEQNLQSELPHISKAILIGDKKKFLCVLLTLKTEVDSDSAAPLDTLTKEVQDWLQMLDCPAKTVQEVLQAGPHEKLKEAIQAGINRANKHAISNAQKIQKFVFLPADLSIATGELGPTLKVKRSVILNKYESIIDNLYV